MQSPSTNRSGDRVGKRSVVRCANLEARKQIANDALEKRHVLVHQLRNVDVSQGAKQKRILGRVGRGALEDPRGREHRLDAPHAKVVVVLPWSRAIWWRGGKGVKSHRKRQSQENAMNPGTPNRYTNAHARTWVDSCSAASLKQVTILRESCGASVKPSAKSRISAMYP